MGWESVKTGILSEIRICSISVIPKRIHLNEHALESPSGDFIIYEFGKGGTIKCENMDFVRIQNMSVIPKNLKVHSCDFMIDVTDSHYNEYYFHAT